MKEYKDIGELFRDNFKDYAPEPSSHVWENIRKKVSKPAFPMRKYIFYGSAMIGIITAITLSVLFLGRDDTPKQQQVEKIITTNKNVEIVVDETIQENTKAISPTENVLPVEKKVETRVFDNKASSSFPSAKDEVSIKPKEQIEAKVEVKQEPQITNQRQAVITKLNNTEQQTVTQKQTKIFVEKEVVKPVFVSRDTIVCENSNISLYVKNARNVIWSNGQTTAEINVDVDQSKIFTVQYTDGNGKDSSAQIFVRVVPCTQITAPTAFTPNNDGINDEFKVFVSGHMSEFEMVIYSNNNKQLFQSTHVERGWNGMFKGELQPQGLYLYRIRYKDNFNQLIEKKGEFLLIQ